MGHPMAETLILAPGDPGVMASLRVEEPGVRLISISHSIPDVRIDGTVWCFVRWLLPEQSGLEMCRMLRDAATINAPHITMLLDSDDDDAKRRALNAGADDYLVGPATAPRILQRLKLYRSNAKRYAPPPNGYVFGDLLIDPEGFQARFQGKRINLAPGEFRLLSHFAENADRVLTRRDLIELAGKDGRVIDERTVDVWVGRLRRALRGHGAPDPLRTVRSVGYVFDRVG